MKQKDFAPIIIVLIATGVLIVGGIWYYEAHLSVSPRPASNPTSTPTFAATRTTTSTAISSSTSSHCRPGAMCAKSSTVSTSGWATYTNSQYDFSFSYPQGLEVSDGGPYTSQSGTQPDSLDNIGVYSSSSLLFNVQIFSPGIVQGDYGWPERPCGEWAFGPDAGPISSQNTIFAGQKTLYLVSRGFGNYSATSSFVTSDYYCVNFPENPIVITFNQARADQIQAILSTFEFSNRPASSISL